MGGGSFHERYFFHFLHLKFSFCLILDSFIIMCLNEIIGIDILWLNIGFMKLCVQISPHI